MTEIQAAILGFFGQVVTAFFTGAAITAGVVLILALGVRALQRYLATRYF